jgi:DNA polymerase-1
MPAAHTHRLFLVDGYALIYRAFFAMIARPLTTQRGENTSAAWGVTNFLLRLRQRHQPDYLGWVHDVGESFRHREYPAYKATREKLGEELQQDFNRSVERIVELLRAFRVPVLGVEGFEADDVIGTLATAAAERGLQAVMCPATRISTSSSDAILLNPGRGGPPQWKGQWVDETDAGSGSASFPGRWWTYLAGGGQLRNIGVRVRKTAVELLRMYGGLDAILSHAAEIQEACREALLQYRADALLSRDLVRFGRIADRPGPQRVARLRIRPSRTPVLELSSAPSFQLETVAGGSRRARRGRRPPPRNAPRCPGRPRSTGRVVSGTAAHRWWGWTGNVSLPLRAELVNVARQHRIARGICRSPCVRRAAGRRVPPRNCRR